MTCLRFGLGEAFLAAILLCFGCSNTDSAAASPGAAGQSAGRGGQGGGGATHTGGAGESAGANAGDGGDAAGSAGEGNEAGTSNGGTGPAGSGGASSNSGASGGQGIAGSTASGGGTGRDECVWDPSSTAHCPVCDANDGCARPGYKYVGSGEITSSCCGLQWQEATAPGEYTWSEAGDYCESLALLGGGWRLPKISELYSLVELIDESHGSPTIDVDAFADTLPEAYWSSSLPGSSALAAWSVNFSDGASRSTQTDQPHRVRCVR